MRAIKTIAAVIVAAAFAGASSWVPAPRAVAGEGGVDVALVLVADISNSMSLAERTFVRESHAVALASPQFLEGIAQGRAKRIAMAYVEFSARAAVRVDWTVIEDAGNAREFATVILSLPPVDRSLGGSTMVHAGLEVAARMFAELPWEAKRLVVDVTGDGRDRDRQALAAAREALIAAGAAINGLPLTRAPDGAAEFLESFYANSVAGGPGHFSLPVTVIDQLPAAMRQKLVRELF